MSANLTDGLVGVPDYAAPRPMAARPFRPWHAPRKQYVRHHQWCAEINQLIQHFPRPDGLLKYLGLPGNDLLDLRHIHEEVCGRHQLGLRFLGFCSSAKPGSDENAALNVSLDEVMRLQGVHHASDVMWDSFQQLSDATSMAWDRANKLGPFDVVNIDLCDGFGSAAPGGVTPDYYNAVNALLALQARYNHSWLLFLTTRVDRPCVNAEVLGRLLQLYENNLTTCASFRAESRHHFEISDGAAARTATETSRGLLRVFLTGLSKWLLHLGLGGRPPTVVRLCSALGYKVVGTSLHEDLVSLAFRFSPTHLPGHDPVGLATPPPSAPNECALAAPIVEQISVLLDVDSELSENAVLRDEMVTTSADLLEQARYDRAAFMTWQNGR